MKFEYNENLDLKERIEIVALEIKQNYPLIENSAAIMSAILSSSIDDKPTNDEKFERYYFLLQNLNTTNVEYLHVFNDLCNVYEDGLENNIYKKCMIEIINFISGKRFNFPELAEFYS